jgi:hypothetical protein
MGWVGGRGTFLILCFATGFVYLFCIGKSYWVLFFTGYIFYGPVFIGFVWEKSFCIQGGISIFSHAWAFRKIIYWI